MSTSASAEPRQAASDGLAAGARRNRQSAQTPIARNGRLLSTLAAFAHAEPGATVGEGVVVGPLPDRPVRPEQAGEDDGRQREPAGARQPRGQPRGG